MKKATKKPVKRAAKAVATESKPDTVLVLRTCSADMKGYADFTWPASGPVEAPDWKPTKECGNGLHGWMWGAGDWSLKAAGAGIRWLVVEVEKASIVDLGGKVKFPRGVVRAVCASWQDAMAIIRPKMPVATGQAASGNYGHAAASGNYGHAAASGNSGHAAASGNSGHAAASGNYGHAAASGPNGWAVAGLDGRVKAGQNGAITALWYDGKRKRVLVGYVGEDGIEAWKWYAVAVEKGAARFVAAIVDCGHCNGVGQK